MSDDYGKLAWWKIRLSEFEFEIVHRAGIKNKAADGISRRPTGGIDKKKRDEKIPVLAITTNMSTTDKTEKEQEAWNN